MTPKPPRSWTLYADGWDKYDAAAAGPAIEDDKQVHVVEYSSYADALHEIVKLKHLADTTEQSNRSYEKALDDALAEVAELKESRDFIIRRCNDELNKLYKQSAIIEIMAEALEGMGKQCVNIGNYGPMKISPGECVCSSCKAKDALEKYEIWKKGENK